MSRLYPQLYFDLGRSLDILNYEAVPSKNQFQKKIKSGYYSLILSVAGQQPIEIELFLGVRINLIEDLVYQFTDGLKEYGPYSNTLVVPARKVQAITPLFYSLHTKQDVSLANDHIMLFLEKYGFPFLEKYSRVNTLDKLYNQYPKQKSPYITNEFHRALRGVVLAKIALRPQWKELTNQYRIKLQQRGLPEVQMQSYERLVRFLTSYSFS